METLVRTGNQLLGGGLEAITMHDKFREAMSRVCDAAFAEVFKAQDEGSLAWKRAGDCMADLVTEVVVKDGRGEEVTIQVILFTSSSDDGFKTAYLMLGGRHDAPCRNTADPRVRHLYTKLTGKPWSNLA